MDLDAHEVFPNLWQGSRPPRGSELQKLGFSTVVFCADEWQPEVLGVEAIYAPNDDDGVSEPNATQLRVAVNAARRVAQQVKEGKKVLVTCWMGLNRSGLVSAIAMHILSGKTGSECAEIIREKREGALFNRGFVSTLEKLGSVDS